MDIQLYKNLQLSFLVFGWLFLSQFSYGQLADFNLR